ncbi:uncharacterized protein LOC135223156 [Macrobrachium nipponense]|uniref:uncharacterized protein LOC135223156 n=1 Tax=Macrobrachium nipponense TaxID=159736 RepID=UPI0030C7C7D6
MRLVMYTQAEGMRLVMYTQAEGMRLVMYTQAEEMRWSCTRGRRGCGRRSWYRGRKAAGGYGNTQGREGERYGHGTTQAEGIAAASVHAGEGDWGWVMYRRKGGDAGRVMYAGGKGCGGRSFVTQAGEGMGGRSCTRRPEGMRPVMYTQGGRDAAGHIRGRRGCGQSCTRRRGDAASHVHAGGGGRP